ncbi:MAG: PilN domain-containing protein [bacterium]
MKKNPVTIEIGMTWLKIVVFKETESQQMEICAFELKDISAMKEQDVVNFIQSYLSNSKIKPDLLSAYIPRNMVTIRKEQLPSIDNKEITEMLDLKIGEYVPYARDEVSYGWASLGQGDRGFTRLMLAIVQRSRLRTMFNVLENARLPIEEVKLSSYSIWNWVVFSLKESLKSDELYIALDIDIDFADLIIFSLSHLLFSRSINIKAGELEEKIHCKKLASEIRQSLVMFQNEEVGNRPCKIFLSGVEKGAGALADFLREDMGLAVTYVPSQKISKEFKQTESDITKVSTSGLCNPIINRNDSMISFTLPELQIKKALKEKTRELITLGSLFICTTALILGIFIGKIHNQQNYLNKLRGSYKGMESEVNKLSLYSKRITSIEKVIKEKGLLLNLLNALYKAVPQNIALLDIDFKDNKLVLKGDALQMSDISDLVKALRAYPYFENVEKKYSRTKSTRKQEINTFEIVCTLAEVEKRKE